jgi:hypothetical protein
MVELENDEVNRQLCAVDEVFDSWSPETQEQILAEWNDWRRDENPGHSCSHCGKTFTRSDNLKRHTKRVHTVTLEKELLLVTNVTNLFIYLFIY